MPRLNHKKTRSGCQRCKARKVKCDELRPRCDACKRHNVDCEYRQPPPPAARTSQRPSNLVRPPWNASFATGAGVGAGGGFDLTLDHALEMRLMHQWTAHTCISFSTIGEYWRYQVPLVAVEFRYLMDALLGLSALHASRIPAQHWVAMEGRMVRIRDPMYPSDPSTEPDRDNKPLWKMGHLLAGYEKGMETRNSSGAEAAIQVAAKRRNDMLTASHIYFDRAIEGHRQALLNVTTSNIEAVYLTSIIVSFNALFALGDSEENTAPMIGTDPVLWMRLANGIGFICNTWRDLVGPGWSASSGVFFGEPDLTDEEELFSPQNYKPFEYILVFALEFEIMAAEDKDAYEKALSYIGLTYKKAIEESESPLATSRRIIAMPPRLPVRFAELVELKMPRALVILAHAFAVMKLIEAKMPWFKGIASRQIPPIKELIPHGWLELMKWPTSVVSGGTQLAQVDNAGGVITP